MNKDKTALVVGRFQPFHNGHLYLIREALKYADKIIIAIGSSNANNKNNPLTYAVRKRMIEKVIYKEKIADRVLKIVPSPDDPDDNVWLEILLKNAGGFDIALGDNTWTNGILKKAGFKVIDKLYYKRNLYQGYIIRNLFKQGKNWQSRVPRYLVEPINKHFSQKV